MSFSSLFQLQQTPVTVYRSSDDNAPHLTDAPGALKTILKSCLVTGYGDKQSLGWEMPFESDDGESAVFRSSDTTSSRCCIKVGSNAPAIHSTMTPAENFTDIDTPVDPWNQLSYTPTNSEWILVGHGKAFIFVVNHVLRGNFVSYPMIFGDIPSETIKTTPNCMFWIAPLGSYTMGGLQLTMQYYPNGHAQEHQNNAIGYQKCNPVMLSGDGGIPHNMRGYCAFAYSSQLAGSPVYAPMMALTRGGTWTFLPMLQPLSNSLASAANLSMTSATTLKVNTGRYGNNSAIIPTDWWYS